MEEGQRFCSNCGAPVENLPHVEPTSTPKVENNAGFAPEPAKKSARRAKKEIRPDRPRKKGGALGWIIALVAVAIVAALVVLNFNVVTNFVDRTISSPEDYYQKIETRNIQAYSEAVADRKGIFAAYGNVANPEKTKTFMEQEITLAVNQKALSTELLDLLEDELGFDLSWLENVGIYVSGGKQDDLIGGEVIAFLNDTDIVGFNATYDTANTTGYVSVPDLSSQYIRLTPDMMSMPYSYRRTTAAAQDLMEALPSEEVLAKLIDRYAGIIIKDLTKVEKGREKISAGDVSATYTVMEVKIDGKTALKLSKDVLSKLRDDRDVEDVICAFLAASGMSEQEVDDAFFELLDEIDDLLARLDELEPSDIRTNIIMDVYVDAAGNVRGRDIKIRKNKDLVAEIEYVLVVSGLKYGVKCNVTAIDSYTNEAGDYQWSDEQLFSLSGSGSVSLKKEIDGSFDLRYKDEYDYNGDVDKTDLKLGKITLDGTLKDEGVNAALVYTPSKDLVEMAIENAYGMPDWAQELVRNLSLSVKLDGAEKSSLLEVGLRNSKKDMLTLSVQTNQIKSYDISVPANAAEPDAWAENLDLSKLKTIIANLRTANVPASLLDELESELDYML